MSFTSTSKISMQQQGAQIFESYKKSSEEAEYGFLTPLQHLQPDQRSTLIAKLATNFRDSLKDLFNERSYGRPMYPIGGFAYFTQCAWLDLLPTEKDIIMESIANAHEVSAENKKIAFLSLHFAGITPSEVKWGYYDKNQYCEAETAWAQLVFKQNPPSKKLLLSIDPCFLKGPEMKTYKEKVKEQEDSFHFLPPLRIFSSDELIELYTKSKSPILFLSRLFDLGHVSRLSSNPYNLHLDGYHYELNPMQRIYECRDLFYPLIDKFLQSTPIQYDESSKESFLQFFHAILFFFTDAEVRYIDTPGEDILRKIFEKIDLPQKEKENLFDAIFKVSLPSGETCLSFIYETDKRTACKKKVLGMN